MPEIADLIISALNLEVSADEIEADAPLFGEGLGLDSIDVLEIALVVSKRYGFQLRSDRWAHCAVEEVSGAAARLQQLASAMKLSIARFQL